MLEPAVNLTDDVRLLTILLRDNSTGANIIWATDNYASKGTDYGFHSQICIPLITGENEGTIVPRVMKSKAEQLRRTRVKAEVFTPSWLCNCQNNFLDEAWFAAKDIFNIEKEKSWEAVKRPIPFPTPQGKTWKDYVHDTRLEITCGEAPYLASRYDTISGESIPIEERIGIMDRKLRVVSENVNTLKDWYHWAKIAVQSTYGYEWQGDSLLLARENILYTYIDHFRKSFGDNPKKDALKVIAEIISWNIWQMDGLKMVIPESCKPSISTNLFGEEIIAPCAGCKNDKPNPDHTGTYCLIKDWQTKDPETGRLGKTLRFIDIILENRRKTH